MKNLISNYAFCICCIFIVFSCKTTKENIYPESVPIFKPVEVCDTNMNPLYKFSYYPDGRLKSKWKKNTDESSFNIFSSESEEISYFDDFQVHNKSIVYTIKDSVVFIGNDTLYFTNTNKISKLVNWVVFASELLMPYNQRNMVKNEYSYLYNSIKDTTYINENSTGNLGSTSIRYKLINNKHLISNNTNFVDSTLNVKGRFLMPVLNYGDLDRLTDYYFKADYLPAKYYVRSSNKKVIELILKWEFDSQNRPSNVTIFDNVWKKIKYIYLFKY